MSGHASQLCVDKMGMSIITMPSKFWIAYTEITKGHQAKDDDGKKKGRLLHHRANLMSPKYSCLQSIIANITQRGDKSLLGKKLIVIL